MILDIYVVFQDGSNRFYFLKVERRDLDVYCFVPKLGAHFSRHQSGESHFKSEGYPVSPEEQPPVIMIGPAGETILNGVLATRLVDLGTASRICTAIFPISSLSEDFRRFNRKITNCFVVDRDLVPHGSSGLEIGVWAVPSRNKISFDWNNPGIPETFMLRATQCEPQIWLYARPAQGWFK